MEDSTLEVKRFCACGCGCEILRFNERHKPRFKFGHAHRLQNNPRWNGGKTIDSYGYIQIRKHDHHFVSSRGYVKLHRLIWEEHHKAILLRWGDVHHINGKTQDNRIENLQGMMHKEHMRINYYSVHKINDKGRFTNLHQCF